MPHNPGDRASQLRQILLHQEQERQTRREYPVAEIGDAAPVSRNVEGQSLDDARAAFRADWQAMVDRKLRRAAWARTRAAALSQTTGHLRIAGPALGAVLGALFLLGAHGFPQIIQGTLLGALFGFLAVIPLMLLTEASAGHWRQHAIELERSAREMER